MKRSHLSKKVTFDHMSRKIGRICPFDRRTHQLGLVCLQPQHLKGVICEEWLVKRGYRIGEMCVVPCRICSFYPLLRCSVHVSLLRREKRPFRACLSASACLSIDTFPHSWLRSMPSLPQAHERQCGYDELRLSWSRLPITAV